MTPTRADWAALARKYRVLAELRRRQHEMAHEEARGPLRQLAREFPGSLRELDALPLEVIEARAASCEAASGGGVVEPWMDWMGAYHASMRVALAVKRRLGGRRGVSEDLAVAVAAECSEPGAAVDAPFVHAVAQPPRGRLNAVVLAHLAARFGKQGHDIALTLFPRPVRAPER